MNPNPTCSAAALPVADSTGGAGFLRAAGAVLTAAAAYHAAFASPLLAPLLPVSLAALLSLAAQPTPRRAFWFGTLAGLAVVAPPMAFLLRVFGAAAPVLWLLIAVWHGVFVLAVRGVRSARGPAAALALAPVLWTGLEYFRGEVWPLRFAWFTTGTAVPDWSGLLHRTGVYGAGFLLMAVTAAGLACVHPGWRPARRRPAVLATAVLLAAVAVLARPLPPPPAAGSSVRAAALQLEFPGTPEILAGLGALRERAPDARLVVLPEYVFDGTVPEAVREWCRRHGTWLIGGGRDPLPEPEAAADGDRRSGSRFLNTAFVVSPDGGIAFRQAKAQPIQFFDDGLPAPSQAPWPSPWGPVGIAVCYDASFRRVMDPLVRAGAGALVIPAMDLEDWGAVQHRLNARMTRIRAAEYGLPILRVGSSGISQFVDVRGRETATAPFPGPGEVLAGTLDFQGPGRVPPDALLAPAALAVTGLVLAALALTTAARLAPGGVRRFSRGTAPRPSA